MDILSPAAALLAFFVKGLAGFANALVFGAIMNFGTDNLQITPLGTLLSTPSNLFIAWKERKNISVKTFLLLTAVMMAGAVPGTFLLKTVDTGLLKKIFGILIVALAAEMLPLPFMAIGLAAGLLLSGRLKAETVRRIVTVLLIFSGVALIFGA